MARNVVSLLKFEGFQRMKTIRLKPEETIAFQELASELPLAARTAWCNPMMDGTVASAFSPRIRSGLRSFIEGQPVEGVLLVKGIPILETSIGPTPTSWATRDAGLAGDNILVAFGSLLGEPFAWENQQNGALVHNILPISAHAEKQVGSSSVVELTWHTEDAFHHGRADYICLLCLRNSDRVATTLAHLAGFDATLLKWKPLWQRRFFIRADDSYFPEYLSNQSTETATSFATDALKKPRPCAVLFGLSSKPYLRIDPAYMWVAQEDAEAAEALDDFKTLINLRLFDIVLETGDLLVIDNFRAVHGRRGFDAAYNGTDRWLKRLNVTLAGQKSATTRVSPREII